ncbi:hypothetical protein TNCV_3100811 [Trichonephila clavipes]|nr:hypothetical protein TNCV_3100811 [Trichonephila clavipes]
MNINKEFQGDYHIATQILEIDIDPVTKRAVPHGECANITSVMTTDFQQWSIFGTEKERAGTPSSAGGLLQLSREKSVPQGGLVSCAGGDVPNHKWSRRQGQIVLDIRHDHHLAERVCERVIVVGGGAVRYGGKGGLGGSCLRGGEDSGGIVLPTHFGVVPGGRPLVHTICAIRVAGPAAVKFLLLGRESLLLALGKYVCSEFGGGEDCLLLLATLLRCVLHVDDAVEGSPPLEQLNVHLALDVHEDEASREPDGHHDQLGPEGPLQNTRAHLLGSAVYQHVQRPHHARYGDHVKRDGA